MKLQGWDAVVLSEPDYEHLVLELHHDGKFLLLLDREDGRDAVSIAFPDGNGGLGKRILLGEFLEQLLAAAEDLRR